MFLNLSNHLSPQYSYGNYSLGIAEPLSNSQGLGIGQIPDGKLLACASFRCACWAESLGFCWRGNCSNKVLLLGKTILVLGKTIPPLAKQFRQAK